MVRVWTALAVLAFAANVRAADAVTPADRSNVIAFAVGDTSNSVEYRRLFHGGQFALIALAAYIKDSSTASPPLLFPASSHYTEFGLGVRRNFLSGDQLRPFAQVTAGRSSASGNCSIASFWDYTATGGGEYFVSPRVSLEGSAGIDVGRGRSDCIAGVAGLTGSYSRTLNTFRAALGINLYF
jgi:hypothetical protein